MSKHKKRRSKKDNLPKGFKRLEGEELFDLVKKGEVCSQIKATEQYWRLIYNQNKNELRGNCPLMEDRPCIQDYMPQNMRICPVFIEDFNNVCVIVRTSYEKQFKRTFKSFESLYDFLDSERRLESLKMMQALSGESAPRIYQGIAG